MTQFKPEEKAYLLDFENSAIEAVTVVSMPAFGIGYAMVRTNLEQLVEANPLNLFRTMESAKIALTNRKRLTR